jgi:hypothetical protein
MIGQPGGHRGRDAERPLKAVEVVVHEVRNNATGDPPILQIPKGQSLCNLWNR